MKNLATLALLLMFSAASFAQSPIKKDASLDNTKSGTLTSSDLTSNMRPDKAAAFDFGKQIIKAYFDQDCNAITSTFDTSLISMESGQSVTINNQMIQGFCSESPLRQDMRLNYSMYEANYSPEIMNFKEYSNAYPTRASLYNMQQGDYFFNGINLNAGATELFRYSDMAAFIIRKTTTGYKIIAM